MAYDANYSGTDISKIVIDVLGSIGVAIVGFGSLVGLVLLYRWFTGKQKRII